MRRDLHLLEEQKLLTRTHGGAVASGVLYELPMRYRGGQHHDAKRAIAAGGRRAASPPEVDLGRAQRRHDDHRGRPGAGRRARPAGRDQRAQHRLRARRPVEHRAGRLRRQRPSRVLRAGRPAGRADPGQHQPRHRDHRRRRRSAPTAGLTTHHEVEAHTNRALVRAAARVDRRRRLEQDRPPRVRQDRRPRPWSPTSSPTRRRRRRRRRRAARALGLQVHVVDVA